MTARPLRRPRAADAVVAIVTRGDVFPPLHGAAVKIERTAWAESHEVRAVCLVTDDSDRYFVYRKGKRSEHPYPARLRPAAHGSGLDALRSAGVPDGDAFLYRPLVEDGLRRRLAHVAARHGVTVFQAEFPAYARPCLEVRPRGVPVLLVEHNVEFERIATLYPDLPPETADWLRRTEVDLCNRCDAVIALSERDRGALAAAGVDRRRLRVVPPGVDLGAYSRARPLDVRRRFRLPPEAPLLVYHGIYRYGPNREALEMLAREVLPRLAAWGLRAKLIAIGADPPAQPPHPDIVLAGPVPSLPPWLLAADVAVVPLLRGGGVRLKLLEYFAAGLPVVATSKAAEGLSVRSGVEALIEDDPARFAAAVARLLGDRERAARLGARGRFHVRGLDWREIARRHLEAAGLAVSPATAAARE